MQTKAVCSLFNSILFWVLSLINKFVKRVEQCFKLIGTTAKKTLELLEQLLLKVMDL